jgi:GDPmannose 4,6-dehydratase
MPEYTASTDGTGALRLLEAIRAAGIDCRYYQASTSEMFGATPPPQDEHTAFYPRSPYGAAKLYAHWVTVNYREAYDLFAVSGILFNHESPRRPLDFVTRKISHAAAAISLGLERDVSLGNLDARRDWGYAGDYVRAMWLMLQQDEPDDYVIASGASHSVRELVECAFARVGLDWQEHVRIDESLVRGKAELYDLVGDPSRARERLGWSPTVDFDELVQLLVDADLERLRAELEPTSVGGL